MGDIDVREKMLDAIYKGFIKPRSDYTLPTKFGMFSDRADCLVQTAIQKFLTHPEVVAARKRLKTPEDRWIAFKDSGVLPLGFYSLVVSSPVAQFERSSTL